MENLDNLIKYFGMFICVMYVYQKLTLKKFTLGILIDILFSILFSIIGYYFTLFSKMLLPYFSLVILIIYFSVRYKSSLTSTAFLTIIAYGIADCIMVLCVLLSAPINYITFSNIKDIDILNFVSMIIIDIIQIVVIYFIFKIKRFKSGIKPSNSSSFILLFIGSVFIILAISLFYFGSVNTPTYEVILTIVLFFTTCFGVWWSKYITDKYKRQVYDRNILLLEKDIETLENKIILLEQKNDELAKIIHRDNKLIPAMEIAVKNFCNKENVSDDSSEILFELNKLSAERKNLILDANKPKNELIKTDIKTLDSVIDFINYKAGDNTKFEFSFNKDSLQILLNEFTNLIELNTLICDLGENGINAVKHRENAHTMVKFDMYDNFPSILFYDNGAPFDEEVIAVIGKKRLTTHANDGGSGIGLVSTFEILKHHKASFYIDYQPNLDDFTKCVVISFDKLNKFSIKNQ